MLLRPQEMIDPVYWRRRCMVTVGQDKLQHAVCHFEKGPWRLVSVRRAAWQSGRRLGREENEDTTNILLGYL